MAKASEHPPALANTGLIAMGSAPGGDKPGRTLIVTGLHRSGTSMVASVLRKAGVFMGETINDLVHEDECLARLVERRDFAGLAAMVRDRNAAYGTWGFKLPMLCQWLKAEHVELFHQPHVAVIFRDPVAISVRATLSDLQTQAEALRAAAQELDTMLRFATALPCPTLLVSYEKALVFPHAFIDTLLHFSGLPQNEAMRQHLLSAIAPNRPDYIQGTRRRFEGVIEGIRDGSLCGWCRLTGTGSPVRLSISLNGHFITEVTADVFRPDLQDAGFGEGRHGFIVPLKMLQRDLEAVLRVTVSDHDIELENSGRPLRDYGLRNDGQSSSATRPQRQQAARVQRRPTTRAPTPHGDRERPGRRPE
jgi:hypothetical protein